MARSFAQQLEYDRKNRLITTAEAALLCGVDAEGIRERVRRGTGPVVARSSRSMQWYRFVDVVRWSEQLCWDVKK